MSFHLSPVHRLLNTVILFTLLLTTTFTNAAEPDKTQEDIQKKAVIVKFPSIKLFKQSVGDSGDDAPFMQIYFMMKPEANGRTPVSRSPNKTGEPDGWLDKESFIEWNTLEMIQLEPQSSRKPAKVFNTQQCASSFSKDGQTPAGCEEQGEEPSVWGSKKLAKPKLLIPIFAKEKDTFQGGFIRVFENGQAVTTTPLSSAPERKKTMGYDIVFAIDSTMSMGKWFLPTTEVIQSFIKNVQNTMDDGEIKKSLRMGVLFYRDRLLSTASCEIGYLTQWRQELTDKIDSVAQALRNEKDATCGSEEPAEAVLDSLSRVLIDTKWADNSFKAIVLIGDAPPHPVNHPKNPMNLNVDEIIRDAETKDIRFLNIKLGDDDEAFKNLALKTTENNKGRYSVIPTTDATSTDDFKSALLSALTREWATLTKTTQIQSDIDTGKTSQNVKVTDSDFLTKYKLDNYEALIILSRLPQNTLGVSKLPEFMKGWIPEKIQGKLLASEFIFMEKGKLVILTNVLDNLVQFASSGERDGPEVFISSVQNALASLLSVQPSELLRSGESLDELFKKTKLLPFKTTMLSFSAQEIPSWKGQDYKRLNMILSEKVQILRSLLQDATEQRLFGDKIYFYVPRAYFP